MYKTILVPLDGSQRAERILPYVEALAQKFGARLILLQVIEPVVAPMTPYGMAPYYATDQVTRWVEEAQTYLAGRQGELQAHGIVTKCFVENGPVVTAILEAAAREQADLIAIASHGRSGLGRVFYGSVAAGLLNQADRPLLLIRAQ